MGEREFAAFVTPASQASTGTSHLHRSRAALTRATRLERAAYVALAGDGLHSVAVHTILAGWTRSAKGEARRLVHLLPSLGRRCRRALS